MATHSSILPGESHAWRSLAGYSPRGHRGSDTTEQPSTHAGHTQGFPGGASGQEPACQCRRPERCKLGRSLEEGTVTHSRILAWRVPWTEEPGGLQSIGLQSQTRLRRLSTHTHRTLIKMETTFPDPAGISLGVAFQVRRGRQCFWNNPI